MSNIKKLIVVLSVVVGILVLFAVIKVYKNGNHEYANFFNAYAEKGKNTTLDLEDINKGLRKK